MARTINQILNQILTNIANDPVLSAINSTSKTAIFNKIAYIISVSMATEEGLNDQFKLDVEAIGATLPPATPNWIQAITFLFQYSSTIPQIPNLNTSTFVPYYPSGVNTAYQIITNCSVTDGLLNQVNVKVAKAGPSQLATTELQALQYYLNLSKTAGVKYNAISLAADRLQLAVTIKYQGIYSSTIQASLLSAYTTYLQTLPFDGIIYLDNILLALKQVPGVITVRLNQAVARPNILAYPGGTILVTGDDWIIDQYTTSAGYIIDEDTPGNDFLSLINLIAV